MNRDYKHIIYKDINRDCWLSSRFLVVEGVIWLLEFTTVDNFGKE